MGALSDPQIFENRAFKTIPNKYKDPLTVE